MSSDLIIGMAGSGGDGIVSAGDAFMSAAGKQGYHALLTKSFGPQIRGGESSCRLRLSTDPIVSPGGNLDLAVALNWDDFLKFGGELPVGGETSVIYDSKTGVAPDHLRLHPESRGQAVRAGKNNLHRRWRRSRHPHPVYHQRLFLHPSR